MSTLEPPKAGGLLGSLKEALAAASRDDQAGRRETSETAPVQSDQPETQAGARRFPQDSISRKNALIFISYRRDDSAWQARQVYDGLRQIIASEQLFMDVDSIPLGVDFELHLRGWIRKSNIVFVLIGKNWLDAIDVRTGERRLDNPVDFVRIEIREALTQEKIVIPLLLDGVAMPSAEDLPADLLPLARRQAEVIRINTFTDDLNRLIRRLGFDVQ